MWIDLHGSSTLFNAKQNINFWIKVAKFERVCNQENSDITTEQSSQQIYIPDFKYLYAKDNI